MTGQGWVTGSDIISKPTSKEYREGWERIFGKKLTVEQCVKFAEKDVKNYKDNGNRPTQRDR